jgi:hypothetical protein
MERTKITGAAQMNARQLAEAGNRDWCMRWKMAGFEPDPVRDLQEEREKYEYEQSTKGDDAPCQD